MKVSFSKLFLGCAQQLDPGMRKRVFERISLFSENPLHPLFRNHSLKGKYRSYRSIDISGDLRALYFCHQDKAVFDMIGTYSQIYG